MRYFLFTQTNMFMKQFYRLLFCFFFISLEGAFAQINENYDDNADYLSSISVFTLDGIKYTITGTNGPYSSKVSNDSFSPLGNNAADYYLLFDANGLGQISSVKIERADGAAFSLGNFSFDAVADGNITVKSSKNGTALTYTSNSGFVTMPNIGASINANFQDITSFTISGGNLWLALDDLVLNTPTVDVTAPTITGVTSSTENGTYKVGNQISIQVNFSEVVTVNTAGGAPQLTLETGTTDRAIDYSSGSGTTTLTFIYTVITGDTSADLDYVSTTALSLNGGTIKDGAGNNAILTLAMPPLAMQSLMPLIVVTVIIMALR